MNNRENAENKLVEQILNAYGVETVHTKRNSRWRERKQYKNPPNKQYVRIKQDTLRKRNEQRVKRE